MAWANATRTSVFVLMYTSKASEDQHPSHCITHLGKPCSAQKVAPPALKLCPVNENSGRHVFNASRNQCLFIAWLFSMHHRASELSAYPLLSQKFRYVLR